MATSTATAPATSTAPAAVPETCGGSLVADTADDQLQTQVAEWNALLRDKSALEIIAWAVETFGRDHTALSSSFGIQAAVMLHLVHAQEPTRVPVIWVDTGYLPAETYQYAAQLEREWNMDVRVYQSAITPARMEALYGRLWETKTQDAHFRYGSIRKVEPMKRAIQELQVKALLVGLRAKQTSHRESMQVVNVADGYLKICPILRWTDEDVATYFARQNLLPHPLQAQGYTTVGDWHSSRPAEANGSDRETRFHGVSQECGMHLDVIVPTTMVPETETLEQTLVAKTKQADGLVLFTKPTCKYCLATKALLQSHGLKYEEFTVGADITAKMVQRIVGQPVRTVPQIFLNGKYVGGYTDLCAQLNVPPRLP